MNYRKETFTTMPRPHEGLPEVTVDLFVREGCENDMEVASEVIYGDGYNLQRMKAIGFEPKTILDCGAHIGAFSCFAHALWPKAEIIAVEPLPSSFDLLAKNCPWAELHNAAVGDSAWPLSCDDKNFGGASMHFGRAPNNSETTPARTSFYCLRGTRQTIDLLKVDCEGAEFGFINDFTKDDRVGCIIGEYHTILGLNRNPFYELRRLIEKRCPWLTVITSEDRDPESEMGKQIGPFWAFPMPMFRKFIAVTKTSVDNWRWTENWLLRYDAEHGGTMGKDMMSWIWKHV